MKSTYEYLRRPRYDRFRARAAQRLRHTLRALVPAALLCPNSPLLLLLRFFFLSLSTPLSVFALLLLLLLLPRFFSFSLLSFTARPSLRSVRSKNTSTHTRLRPRDGPGPGPGPGFFSPPPARRKPKHIDETQLSSEHMIDQATEQSVGR